MAKITSETALFSTGIVNLYIHGHPFIHCNVNPFLFHVPTVRSTAPCLPPSLSLRFFNFANYVSSCLHNIPLNATLRLLEKKRERERQRKKERGKSRSQFDSTQNVSRLYRAIYHRPRCFIRRDWLMSLLPGRIRARPKNYPISMAVLAPPPTLGRFSGCWIRLRTRIHSSHEKSGNHKSPSELLTEYIFKKNSPSSFVIVSPIINWSIARGKGRPRDTEFSIIYPRPHRRQFEKPNKKSIKER